MNPRIELDESVLKAAIVPEANDVPPPPVTRHLLDADWEDSETEPLMLYVAEEPRVGLEFAYHGLSWQIVDYRNGWVASLVVE